MEESEVRRVARFLVGVACAFRGTLRDIVDCYVDGRRGGVLSVRAYREGVVFFFPSRIGGKVIECRIDTSDVLFNINYRSNLSW